MLYQILQHVQTASLHSIKKQISSAICYTVDWWVRVSCPFSTQIWLYQRWYYVILAADVTVTYTSANRWDIIHIFFQNKNACALLMLAVTNETNHLAVESIYGLRPSYHPHPSSPFVTITQPKSWYFHFIIPHTAEAESKAVQIADHAQGCTTVVAVLINTTVRGLSHCSHARYH